MGFCQRFNLEPQVQQVEDNGDNDDAHGSGGLDSEIVEQSELDHFSAVLRCAQQIAIQLDKDKDKSRKRKIPRQYKGNSLKTISRRKRAKLQLAEKGFLGIFEFLNLPKQGGVKESSAGTTNNLAQVQSTNGNPIREEEEEDSTGEDAVKVDVMEAVTVVARVSVEGCPKSSHNNKASEAVRALILSWVLTDSMQAHGVGNDTLPKVIEQSVEALSDNEEDVSKNGSEDEEENNNTIHMEARNVVEGVLEDLHQRRMDTGSTVEPRSAADRTLDLWNDRTALHTACAKLSERSKQKNLDIILRARITAMVGVLNLYLDSGLGYSWRSASLVVAKAWSQGVTHARNLRKWILDFIRSDQLPLHRYGQSRWTVLEDEDISQGLQLQLSERAKRGYIKAADVVEIVSSPEMQAILTRVGVCKPTIAERTARNWLKKLSWRYEEKRNGMYIDGHEREDVVLYRKGFIARWKEYETRFHKWDNDGNLLPLPTVPHSRLILVTHDESTFYQNDERKTHWVHSSTTATPKPKGNGQSLMVSDFLTVEWGRLCDGNECVSSFPPPCVYLTHPISQARILFKAGKNREGYFGAKELHQQVNNAIDIFEKKTNGSAQGLFMFDNAPSHQKRAPDAVSARKMVKSEFISLRSSCPR